MKTNLIKRITTIAAVVAVTLTIGAGGVFAQGSVPSVPDITDNGIVKDGGLVWLKNADCFGRQNWNQAMSSAVGLKSGSCGLTDGSTAGQWRLPTKDELISRQRNQQGFNNVQADFYWSSGSYADDAPGAWVVNMFVGDVHYRSKGFNFYVWPVRAGQ